MGMFKAMKDTVSLVNAAPGLVDQANQLAAQAQQLAAAQQLTAERAVQSQFGSSAGPSGTGGDLEPIEGVTLQTYATIARRVADQGLGETGIESAAALHGISRDTWDRVAEGWATRMRANPAVGQAFHRAYTGA